MRLWVGVLQHVRSQGRRRRAAAGLGRRHLRRRPNGQGELRRSSCPTGCSAPPVRSGFGYAWPPIRGDLFDQVVRLELMVLRSDPMPGALHEPTVVRVELHDHGDKTRMTLIDGPFLGA